MQKDQVFRYVFLRKKSEQKGDLTEEDERLQVK